LIPVLAGLLILQIVLAAGVHLGSDDYRVADDGERLLAVTADAVDGVRIEDGENSVELQKQGDRWQVTALDFPADDERVSQLLDKLAGLEKGWPVATSDEAAERFKVSEDDF